MSVATARSWEIDTTNRADVPTLRTRVQNGDDRLTLLFLGDLHWDHELCARNDLKAVLDRALDEDAVILLLGDTLCGMQNTNDPRASKSALRPEHARDDYLGALVETWCDWYAPYAANTWVALTGNHESALVKRHGLDVTRAWVERLNARGAAIQYPGYTSYALVRNTAHTRSETVAFWVGHGHGGGGEVTRGTIQAQRRAVTFPDARFLVTGHIHSSYQVDHEQLRVTANGRVVTTVQEHLSCGTWKDEFGVGAGGYHVEKGRGPRQRAGWWARFRYSNPRGFRWTFEKAAP